MLSVLKKESLFPYTFLKLRLKGIFRCSLMFRLSVILFQVPSQFLLSSFSVSSQFLLSSFSVPFQFLFFLVLRASRKNNGWLDQSRKNRVSLGLLSSKLSNVKFRENISPPRQCIYSLMMWRNTKHFCPQEIGPYYRYVYQTLKARI